MDYRVRMVLIVAMLIITIGSIGAAGVQALSKENYHLKLLAVQEGAGGEMSGSEADVFLEVRKGRGRVFLDTYPATKMDTQISTRYARDIACEFAHADCTKYDFIYTIKAKSNIIGGPSAGAAVSAITAISLLDLPYSDEVAVTGTINSGGIVGPVGGIKQKIEAARKANIKKVLIAQGSANSSEISNATNETISIDLISYAKENLSVEVVEVTTLEDVLFYLTGKNVTTPARAIEKDDQYHKIMKEVRNKLCMRAAELNYLLESKAGSDKTESIGMLSGQKNNNEEGSNDDRSNDNNGNNNEDISKGNSRAEGSEIEVVKEEGQENRSDSAATQNDSAILNNETREFYINIEDRFNRSEQATMRGDDYSSASFCFGINIELQDRLLRRENVSAEELGVRWSELSAQVNNLSQMLDERLIRTISDLQTKMIVEERIGDVLTVMASSDKSRRMYAYALERFHTARVWQDFFTMEGRELKIDEQAIMGACEAKMVEARERLQYTELFLAPGLLAGIEEKIATAIRAREDGRESLCLSMASQAKADSNAVLTSIGLSEGSVREFIASKQNAVEKVIWKQSERGVFPILGYSYYEYAKTLSLSDPFTALVYMEYALELSDLSLYFPEGPGVLKAVNERLDGIERDYYLLFAGAGIGVISTVGVWVWLQYEAFKKRRRRGNERQHWRKL